MKIVHIIISTLLFSLYTLADGSILQNSFTSEAEQQAYTLCTGASWVKEGENHFLKVTATDRHSFSTAHTTIDFSPYRGKEIILKCRIKAENVSKPEKSYNGIKFMLNYKTPSCGEQWPGIGNEWGSCDWKNVSRRIALPDDISKATIVLGLQDSTGTVMFDDLQISPARHQIIKHPAAIKNPPPAFKGHSLPRLRGAMCGSGKIDEEDIRNFAENWGGNLIRFQINRNWHKADDNRDIAEYNRWVDSRLDVLEKVLTYCEKYGMYVVADLHALPGGRYENRSMAMFYEKPYAEAFVQVWEKIAKRFKGNRFLWAYDLVNEPVHDMELPDTMDDFRELQIKAAMAIRKIDPEKPIIFEVFKWDSPDGFNYMGPIDMPNVIYQAHMYLPHAYTHQGINNSPTGIIYPGKINGKMESKETLREYLKPVRDFQLAYNVHIYIGEFSAARWAPGAENYLSDVISIFEEYDWDWSYHAYREADCWSLEHVEDKNKVELASEPTERLKVIKKWFSKNKRAK